MKTKNENERRFREALSKIAEVAGAAVADTDTNGLADDSTTDDPATGQISCSIKSLPGRLLNKAAETARQVNPVNAPVFGSFAEMASDTIIDPQFLTLLTSKYWGSRSRQLSVSFMEATPANLRARILSHMNAWTRTGCISFRETMGTGQIRISRGPGGYWSYLGTDVLLIPRNRPTMNLQGFTMNTPESEYKRVVRHETGHTLGFPHEHMRRQLVARIDPQKAYRYFLERYGWSRTTVDQQVLTPLNDASIIGTPPDQTSIMCYQLPGSITRDGLPIIGGLDINTTDYTFAGRIYPRPGHDMPTDAESMESDTTDWSEYDDVMDDQIQALIQETLYSSDGPTDRSAEQQNALEHHA